VAALLKLTISAPLLFRNSRTRRHHDGLAA
jgi:hypothetical protein